MILVLIGWTLCQSVVAAVERDEYFCYRTLDDFLIENSAKANTS